MGRLKTKFSDSMTYSYKLLYTGFVCNGGRAGLQLLYIGSLAHSRQPILASSSYNTYVDYLVSSQRSPCSFYLLSCRHLSSMMSITLLDRTSQPILFLKYSNQTSLQPPQTTIISNVGNSLSAKPRLNSRLSLRPATKLIISSCDLKPYIWIPLLEILSKVISMFRRFLTSESLQSSSVGQNTHFS